MITSNSIDQDINEKIETVKLILYKDFNDILSKVDFENDEAFCDPLIFAFFRHKTVGIFPIEIEHSLLYELLQGYFKKREPLSLNYLYNFEGMAYEKC